MLSEALDYFQQSEGFTKLFALFRKKMESFGRVGGSVSIKTFSDRELADIAQFFGLTVEQLRQKKSVTLVAFEKKLAETRFEGIGLYALLEGYYGEKIIAKKDVEANKRQRQENELQEIRKQFPDISFWVDYLLERNPDTYWIYRYVDEGKLQRVVPLLHEAFQQLPNDPQRLPVFSQKITGDPHSFDLNTEIGRLFIHMLQVKRRRIGEPSLASASEEMNELLAEVNILRDDITNYVTTVNLLAEVKNDVHPLWAAASRSHAVLNIPLRELQGLEQIYPSQGGQVVWLVENSGVFSSLLDAVPAAPLVCTHGQFNLATLKVLDALTASGCGLRYSGDFDPEGLLMAQRLLDRYPEHVQLWHMDEASYQEAKSQQALSRERLQKLKHVTADELAPVVRILNETKRAGYQEGLLSQMVEDLQSM